MSQSRPPNVLWIFADQLRYHALSCHGNQAIKTAHIDRLATEGYDCHRAFSHYPVCTPFRAGLMTAKHATQCGVPLHGDFLPPDSHTVAHSFREAGYRTSYVGKWHLAGERGLNQVSAAGWAGEDFWVHPQQRGGFEDWYGFNVSNNFYRTFYCTGEKLQAHKLEGYQTDGLTDLSLNYLQGYQYEQPWFHVISYEAPHPGQGGTPKYPGYPVPERYEKAIDSKAIELRPNVPAEQHEAARMQLAGYYAMLLNLDDNVGRLLSWLDASGQSENTIVVFFADHGEMGGSQGLRHKHVPYDESIHIPLMIRYPAGLQSKAARQCLMSGLDIFPTSAGLAGVAVPPGLHGIDQSACLQGKSMPRREAVLVEWEGTRFDFGDHPYRAIRTETHSYVVGRDQAFCLLFDNQQDPYQLHNLFGKPEVAELQAQLHQRLVGYLERSGASLPGYLSN